MARHRTARLLFTFVALFLTLVPPIVDWTPTHVFHPGWTGHARLHMVWLLGVNSGLGLLVLFLLWGPGEDERARLRLAGVLEAIILGAFFVAAALRPAYDGALSDLHGGVTRVAIGIDANVAAFSILSVLVAIGFWNGRERLG